MSKRTNNPKPLPSQEHLRKILDYDEKTGILTWRERDASQFGFHKFMSEEGQAERFNKLHAGKEAFRQTGHSSGGGPYKRGTLKGYGSIFAHRVAWKWWHGTDPDKVDHIDRDVSNNRIINLRSVTDSVNNRNCKKRKDNTSGVTGVYWAKDRKKWRVIIAVGKGKLVHYGQFVNFEDAVVARKKAEKKHNFHKNHGLEPDNNERVST